jgi:hypothetical protein
MTGYTFSQLFDFTRTTAGTFVGSNGLIQNTPASVNLLTFTQEFDNAVWSKNSSSITANTTIAPDGTATADKLVEAATTSVHNCGQSITTQAIPYTFSCYVKAAERTFALLYHTQTNAAVSINLTTGETATPTGLAIPTSSSVTAVGNGWYRLSMTVTATAASNFFGVYPMTSLTGSASYTGDGTSGIFLWGAQLELGSTATDYTRNNGGVFPARFEYDPVTLAPKGILIEEQRTNLLLRSEEFDNASWNKLGATITANVASSPDGALGADALVEDTSTGAHVVFQPISFVSGTTYTVTVFAKAGTRTRLNIVCVTGAIFNGDFDLTNGTITGTYTGTSSITPAGNGWYRCQMTATAGATASGNVQFRLISSGAITSYTGDGTSGLFLWGAQIEAGAFATSYIPTVASQVTRSADVCTITAPMFAPWYNQSAGTFLVEYTQGSGTTARAATVASDGTNSNTVELYIDGSNDATTLPFYGVYVAGAAQAALSFAAATQNATHKMGAAYQANDFAGSVDGASVVTDTSGTLPTVNRLSIGSSGTAATAFANGHIRRITYYPFRASNNQLQQVTT